MAYFNTSFSKKKQFMSNRTYLKGSGKGTSVTNRIKPKLPNQSKIHEGCTIGLYAKCNEKVAPFKMG